MLDKYNYKYYEYVINRAIIIASHRLRACPVRETVWPS